ncbi:MFS transporter [Streptomyces sp. NPDC048182]|uniref:MFS transporter n=1 Tax=Streptomyces sp. NPDC048182 TaxID=3365507 RepID=UPI003723D90B
MSARPAPDRPSRRPIFGVWAAMAVANTGTRVSAVALPWFVLVTTDSAALTGLVAFCELTPYVAVKALSGPLVDRIGPRRVSLSTDVVSALSAACLAALSALGLLHFGLLLALVALIGAARGPGDLAKDVLIPEAARRSGVALERATGVGGVIENGAQTVGPGLGGALIAVSGPMTGVLVNAAAFALGSVLITMFVPRGDPDGAAPDDTHDPERPGYWRSMGDGFRWLRGNPLVLSVLLVVGLSNLLGAGWSSVLLPVWARSGHGGPAAVGLLGTVLGASAVCGSLVAATIAERLPRRWVFLVGFVLAGAPRFVVLATGAPLWGAAVVVAVGGFGAGFLNPITSAVIFERIPRALLGRVVATGDSLAWAGIPAGVALAGVLVGAAGLVPVLLGAGALSFGATVLPFLRPEWKQLDRARPAAPPGPEAGARSGPETRRASPEDAAREDAARPASGQGAVTAGGSSASSART